MHIGMFYQVQVPKPWNSTSDSDRHWDMMDQVVSVSYTHLRSPRDGLLSRMPSSA